MFRSGVLVNAWVKIDGGTTIEYVVLDDVVEFYFGGQHGDFQLLATHRGLRELVTKSAEALLGLEAADIDE